MWTAYKFTEKTPVKGQFRKNKYYRWGRREYNQRSHKQRRICYPHQQHIYTNWREIIRSKSFLGIMQDPELLSGKLMLENDSIGHAFNHERNNKQTTV